MPDEDRWIISRINTLAEEVSADIEECQLHRATRNIIHTVLEDISRWYVQLIRPRMWLEDDSVEKRQAYETMYYLMRRLVGIMAPFTPHIAESIYENLKMEGDPASVHMLDWFTGEEKLRDAGLEEEMAIVRSFDEATATARQDGRRKLRWPIGEAIVITDSDAVESAILRMNELCKARANSRSVTVIKGTWERMGWSAEPIEDADADSLKLQIERSGTAEVSGFGISKKHVTFNEQLPEDVFSAEMTDATVCVDVTLTEELEAEGFAREVVRRLQEMRRQLDLNVEDFITAVVRIDDRRVADLLEGSCTEKIMQEVRARTMTLSTEAQSTGMELTKDWEVEGISMTISLSRAAGE